MGYPCGAELKTLICRYLCQHGENIDPYIAANWPAGFRRDMAVRFGNSAHGSIDAFLSANPQFIELGKVLIVALLKRHEDMEKLVWPNDPGWYSHLFDALVRERMVHEVLENALSIVTFNYDRSLQAFLTQRIRYHYNVTESEAAAIVQDLRIIHPHGMMGPYPEVPYANDTSDDLAARAASIKVICEFNDSGGEFCSDEFKAAHDAIASAERLYFLGFGLHGDNLRRLRVREAVLSNRRMRGKLMIRSTLHGVCSVEMEALERCRQEHGLQELQFHETTCNSFFRDVVGLR
ncbi:MAG: hypothetical protein HPY69_05735 [Armatimonadetes bacterium]|nr:hypothetical protein [Armatimonadota bacterium]